MIRFHILRSVGTIIAGLILLVGLLIFCAPLWVIDQWLRLELWHAGVHGHNVMVNGDRVHYLELKPGSGVEGRTLLLIHGLGGRAQDWTPMIASLAASGFHVYAIDLLGYGHSAHPADASFSIAQQTAMVSGFMRALDLRDADVGGWSMGGWIAMNLAAQRPDTVRRLVLYDSAGVYFRIDSPTTVFAPETEQQYRELVAKLTPRHVPAFVLRAGLRRLRSNGWVISRSVASMTSGADLMDFRLYQVRQPTLIVWGADDRLIPPAVGEELHQGIADSSLKVLPSCGHLAPLECSGPVLAATLRFLGTPPPIQKMERKDSIAAR